MLNHVKTLVDLQKNSHKMFRDKQLFKFFKNGKVISKTYNDWFLDTNRYSNFLISQNIRKGDKLGMISDNSYEWATLSYA